MLLEKNKVIIETENFCHERLCLELLEKGKKSRFVKLYHTRHTKMKLEREQEERNNFLKMINN